MYTGSVTVWSNPAFRGSVTLPVYIFPAVP
jgi:hypothetical protein